MNVKPVAETVNTKLVVAVIAPEVPVTVIVKLPVALPVAEVAEAEIAAETVHGAVGVQVAETGVNTAVTPEGRADSETTTGAATPAVVVTVKVSVPAGPA